jgi:hypothetical protein
MSQPRLTNPYFEELILLSLQTKPPVKECFCKSGIVSFSELTVLQLTEIG